MYRKLFFLLVFLSSINRLYAQDTKWIQFRAESPVRNILHYHIVAVKDERADTASIGQLKMGVFGKKTVSLNFEQGVATAAAAFIQKNFRQDTTATDVELHITDLHIKEGPSGLRSQVNATVTTAFFVSGKKITEYTAQGNVQSMGDMLRHVEALIRESLRNSLLEFDNWWGKNRQVYAPNAPVLVSVQVLDTMADKNLMGYSIHRPLVPNDFMGKPDELSRAAGLTASGITLKYSTDIDNGQIRVLVLITPYFNKLRSWLRNSGRNPAVLSHEQKHYDITALKACELADTLRRHPFTRDTYLETLEQIHLQIQRDMEAMQTQYDAETRHGINITVQDKWNKLIKELLAAQSCYR
jgi:hypothetical protein